MIRPLRILIALACLAAGAALGALNPEPVTVDVGVLRFEAALGVILLGVLLLGVVLGGLALTVSVVLPMRHRQRRERAAAAARTSAAATSASEPAAPPVVAYSTDAYPIESGNIEHGIR
jgi:putative membrane protein